jgi:sugar phosphate isomerase/epimerase
MAKPISLQLYSLREESSSDFTGVLESVADIGYRGVEPAGFYDLDPREFRSIVEDLGMVVSSSHGPWATPDNTSEVIETAGILGLSTAGGGFGADYFKDMSAIKRTADMVNEMVEILSRAGLNLFLHNHWWEFTEVEGALAYDHFAELCPDVQFEIDTYWAANFGANDPVVQVAKFRDRTPLLHIKDGPLLQGEAMVAVGQGKMDIAGVIEAAAPDLLQWLIVELDACDTDMLTAVKDSYRYLTENGLAKGMS